MIPAATSSFWPPIKPPMTAPATAPRRVPICLKLCASTDVEDKATNSTKKTPERINILISLLIIELIY